MRLTLAILILTAILMASIAPGNAEGKRPAGKTPPWLAHLCKPDAPPPVGVSIIPPAARLELPNAGEVQIPVPDLDVSSAAGKDSLPVRPSFIPTDVRVESYNIKFRPMGLDGNLIPVPEPSGLIALAGPATAGLLYRRRR